MQKEKDGKDQKQVAKVAVEVATKPVPHKLPTQQFIVQAMTITSFDKPRVKIPYTIQVALKRAIQIRKTFAEWYQRASSKSEV